MPVIGRLFGKRDHTTVLHALKKFGVWPLRRGPDESTYAPRECRREGCP
jgi:hypothetical protein